MLNIFKNLAMQFYHKGWYSTSVIASFVQCGALTADDYKEITGDNYVTQTVSQN